MFCKNLNGKSQISILRPLEKKRRCVINGECELRMTLIIMRKCGKSINSSCCYFFLLFICLFSQPIVAAIQFSGTCLVNLNASQQFVRDEEWINTGELGNFKRVGSPHLEKIGGQTAMVLDGIHDAWRGPLSVLGIERNGDRSIEVWVYNPTLEQEETMVAWGRRGQTGKNISFNFGSSPDFGATTHWAADLGWTLIPSKEKWHYLVYTYDGEVARVYHNTRERSSRKIILNTSLNATINIGVQNSSDGTPQFENEHDGSQLALSGAIATVRIHDGVLTPEQIAENFKQEAKRFDAFIPADPRVENSMVLTGDELKVSILPYYHTAASLCPEKMKFDFTPADRLDQRMGSNYHHLGDCSLMWRQLNGPWHTFDSAHNRNVICEEKVTAVNSRMDITPLLGAECPLNLEREWTIENGQLALRFYLKNKSQSLVEIGAFGAAMVFNNLLTGRNLNESHEKCVFVEPYTGGDAGYLQVTRLNGHGPVLLVVPESGTRFENYRLLREDPTPLDVTFEGFYEWMTCSKGWAETQWEGVPQPNAPTSRMLNPGDKLQFGFIFVLAESIRDVETSLARNNHPVAISFPGYVLPFGESSDLFIKSPGQIAEINSEPSSSIQIKPNGLSNDKEWKRYLLVPKKRGLSRVVVTYSDGLKQYIHYNIISSQHDQVRRLAQFHERKQWLDAPNDPYGRTNTYMSYDNEDSVKILGEYRSYISGLSDEPGAGPNLAMAIKNLMDPDLTQVAHLEQYVNNVLWGGLQNRKDYGIRASMFYGTQWNEPRSKTTWRAYNYPHQAAIYWCLYRLARNYTGLVKSRSWDWFLRQAYRTGLAMKDHCGQDDFLYLSQYGLMVGSVFPEILNDLRRENWKVEADQFEAFMRSRFEIWKNLEYPYGSEMPWDSTGQEEVYLWCDHFGEKSKALVTLNAILAYMPSIPDWAYNGNARRYFDSFVYGKFQQIARESCHYGSSLNAIPVLEAYRDSPGDFHLLRVGYAGSTAVLANIADDGFGSMCFINDPTRMEWEPYSSDYGVAFYGYSYSAGCYMVDDPIFGLLCFGGNLLKDEATIRIIPADAYRRRVFLAPYGLWLTLESGYFKEIVISKESNAIQVYLGSSNNWTPTARLVIEQSKKTKPNFKPVNQFKKEREAWVIPLDANVTKIELK
jgi:hypothetical protein